MRTPMNGILGFSELLRRKNISEEKKDIYLELIEKEGHRLLSFISNIVDISKIESNIINIENMSLNRISGIKNNMTLSDFALYTRKFPQFLEFSHWMGYRIILYNRDSVELVAFYRPSH